MKIRTDKLSYYLWSALVIAAILLVATPGSAWPASAENPREDAAVVEPAPTADTSKDAATEINIDNFAFTPASVTVKVGTQVTWINHDDIPHTVDSTQSKFKSAALDTDEKFQFRFTEPGEYEYFCRIHPKMTGKIIVQR